MDEHRPVAEVRQLADELRGSIVAWRDRDGQLLEKFTQDMTAQDFVDAGDQQPSEAIRTQARTLAAFMVHEGASPTGTTTLGEVLARGGAE
jgi:hypothetical protein